MKSIRKPLLATIVSGTTLLFTAVTPAFAWDNYSRNYYDTMTYPSAYSYSTQTYTQAFNNDQQMQLRTLLEQHATVGAMAFIARYDQSPDVEQLKQQVDDNTQQLTQLLGQLYGPDNQGQFQDLWNTHIDLLGQYTDAVRNNDDNQKQEAVQGLDDFVNNISNFFTQNDQTAQPQLARLFQMHIDDEKGIIDAHAQNDQMQQQMLMQQAPMHADMIADAISQFAINNNLTSYQPHCYTNNTNTY